MYQWTCLLLWVSPVPRIGMCWERGPREEGTSILPTSAGDVLHPQHP